ncbi:intracellular protein transport protein USO1 isoform X1 [Monomorium pharaonis]|uniref:intracellular protein transport protein USO1 isoform X1 n=2 Tax=Monomorium pharaonis TaxID=307658 RepID=UPI0017476EE9|nr:intracellular protein transport protein USO1 isoform X1 [Monomorium pharaonis]
MYTINLLYFRIRKMSDDLLAKEKEFHRLNYDLQLRTRNVMKTVDSIIHVHADKSLFSNTNHSFRNYEMEDAKAAYSKNRAPKINRELKKSLIKVSEIPLGESTKDTEILKDNTIGNKAIITLLKGKIDIFYKKLQSMQLEYNNKCDYCKELEIEKKKLNNTQIKLWNQIEVLNDTITKLEHANSDTLLDYQALSNENIVLKKDLEGFQKEIRILNQQSINLDVRLNRSLESNEKLKNALRYSHTEEKELRNQIRKLQEDKKLAIKNLEKQRSELVQAFKKQTLLIDNLKKQNTHLMANGQVGLAKEDFAKLLEWKPQNISDVL